MMRWYLYTFAAERPGDFPCGVGGTPVFVANHKGVYIVASQWEGTGPPPATAETALAHEAVVEAAMGESTVLPCRLGTVVDQEFCLEFVARYAGQIRSRLEQVAGQVEVSVKVFDRPATEQLPRGARPPSGLAYLLRQQSHARHEEQRTVRAGTLADEIDERVAPWTTDRHRQLAPSREVLAALTYLIPRAATPWWSDAVTGLRDRFPAYDFLATGPWPPYHFAEVRSRGGRNAQPDPGTRCET
jgi:hypothetical protein